MSTPSAERDYNFYRLKAGLDFNKYIEKLTPDKDGEEVFNTFVKRYDAYYKSRSTIIRKYEKLIANEYDEDNIPRYQGEKMRDLAQLEQMFIDVLRVIFGLAPDDNAAKFGDTIATRYTDFVKGHACVEDRNKGLYIGADGLYRMMCFYDDDEVEFKTLLRWNELDNEMAYKPDYETEEKKYDFEIYINGTKVKIPSSENDLEKQFWSIQKHLFEQMYDFTMSHPKVILDEDREKIKRDFLKQLKSFLN